MTGELTVSIYRISLPEKTEQDENHVCFEERWRNDAS